MLITCENCHTKYKLDDSKLPAGGHKVRCTKCLNTWFVASAVPAAAPAAVEAASDEMASFEAALAETAAQDGGFESFMPESGGGVPADHMPTSLKSFDDHDLPVVDHKPGGMGAGQFGFFTFLLLTFLTLIAILLLRAPIVHHWPAMASLYKAAGLSVPVPGEGLKLSEMTASQQALTLNIAAKLSNISEQPLAYPKMKVYMRGPYGATLKEWDIPAQKITLAPGQTAPVSLSLEDAPAEGKTVDLVVSGN